MANFFAFSCNTTVTFFSNTLWDKMIAVLRVYMINCNCESTEQPNKFLNGE